MLMGIHTHNLQSDWWVRVGFRVYHHLDDQELLNWSVGLIVVAQHKKPMELLRNIYYKIWSRWMSIHWLQSLNMYMGSQVM